MQKLYIITAPVLEMVRTHAGKEYYTSYSLLKLLWKIHPVVCGLCGGGGYVTYFLGVQRVFGAAVHIGI